MIRRDIQSHDGAPAWLLISQVEHARVSGELARAWNEEFSEEVIAGITHHDDGWPAWEAAPQFNRNGRPLSFMELDISDALTIWDRSIAAARSFGPLAGAIVAGHFIGLARGSEQAMEPRAATWVGEMENRRSRWLVEWRNTSPANTARVAERAQQMLATADLLSLWLCCNGPLSSQHAGSSVITEMKDRAATVLGKYRFIPSDETARYTPLHHGHTHPPSRVAEIAWQGSMDPWPLGQDVVQLAAHAVAVPAAKFSSGRELGDVDWPVELVWELRKTLPPTAEC